MNFTLSDLLTTFAAILIFPLFVIVPGYVLGYHLDLVSFRQRSPLLRLLLSLPFSVSLTPVILYLAGKQFSTWSIWLFYGMIWLSFLLMQAARRQGNGFPGALSGIFPAGVSKPLAVICSIWTAVAVLSLIDLQLGHKLFITSVSYDYTVRSAAISQLARAHWFPLTNPFFFPGHPTPFRYHYFWFLLCSLPVRLLPWLITPRSALFSGVVWIGFTLMATIALYLRLFSSMGAQLIKRRTLYAFGLLSISGLDILPISFFTVRRLKHHSGILYPSVDWWNPDQVTGWLDSTLWVPHHLAGLLACMTGFLILWTAWHPSPITGSGASSVKRMRWQTVIGAGLAFGSAAGLSVYVTFAFAAFLGVWFCIEFSRKHYQQVVTLMLVGLTAAVLGSPFLWDLAAAGSGGTTGQGASFIKLGMRVFGPAHLVLYALHRYTPLWLNTIDFLLLPVNLLFELGALFLLGIIKARRSIRSAQSFSPAELAAATMVLVCLSIGVFIRSNTIQTNDLGMRALLVVQFILVLWGADILVEWPFRNRAGLPGRSRFTALALVLALILGAVTNLYELLILRSFTILTESGIDPGVNLINPGKQFAERAFASRQMYEWLDHHAARSAVEQHNPADPFDPLPGLYSDRQMALKDSDAASAFGGSQQESRQLDAALTKLFTGSSGPVDPDALCQHYKINYLISRSGDPAWQDKQSWVWMREPVYANAAARAFACGPPTVPRSY